MPTGTLKKQWQVAGNAGWAETFNFYLGNTATPDDLAALSCAAQLNLLQGGRPPSEVLTFNSADSPPYLWVSGGSVGLDIPRAVTAAWTAGVYDVQLRVIDPAADVDRYTLVGSGRLNVIEAPGS